MLQFRQIVRLLSIFVLVQKALGSIATRPWPVCSVPHPQATPFVLFRCFGCRNAATRNRL